MTLPWDNAPRPQQQPYTPPPRPYTPPPPQPQQQQPSPPTSPSPAPSYSPGPAEAMRPDIAPPPPPPPPAQPRFDIAAMIQAAVNEAIVNNKDQLQANAQRALVKGIKGEKITVKNPGNHIEDSWQSGPATKKTLVQGLVVDVGFAVMAALATVTQPGFNFFDAEAWTVVGALVIKTVLTTAISYMTKLKVD